MRKILLFLLIIVLGIELTSFASTNANLKKTKANPSELASKKPVPVIKFGPLGEKITYNVRLGAVSLGRAVFIHAEDLEFNGRPANLVTFDTKVVRFSDSEKIYSDADSFLPLQVERQIKNVLSQENIIEIYDQKKFTLTITKLKGGKKEELVIKKKGPIQNAILLPYYVRRIPKLDIGWTLPVELPTHKFLIKLVSIEDIRVPAGKFKAYHFESSPKKFSIWITADHLRIPVKIRGIGVLGYTMVMQDYSIKRD